MARMGVGVWLAALGAALGCQSGRPPPAGRLSCNDNPSCSGAVAAPDSEERDDAYRALCVEAAESDAPVSASLGYFSAQLDPTSLAVFDESAAIYGKASVSGKLSCTSAFGAGLFELVQTTTEPGPMRIQPAETRTRFTATLLNRVDFQELPLKVPVFPRDVVQDIFDDVDIQREADLATLVIEVLEPPGFFDTDGRPRHQGSRFEAEGAEAVAYLDGDRWTLDASATTKDGLAAILNVQGTAGLGKPVLVMQTETDGDTSLERHLWASTGAVTFAAMPPAR